MSNPLRAARRVAARSRSAVSGRFVSRAYARLHPETTINETRKRGNPVPDQPDTGTDLDGVEDTPDTEAVVVTTHANLRGDDDE